MWIYFAAGFMMNTRRPGGGRGTSRREKCQWFGARPEGELGLRGRALKAATVSAGFIILFNLILPPGAGRSRVSRRVYDMYRYCI